MIQGKTVKFFFSIIAYDRKEGRTERYICKNRSEMDSKEKEIISKNQDIVSYGVFPEFLMNSKDLRL
jgi:hypothetical protein